MSGEAGRWADEWAPQIRSWLEVSEVAVVPVPDDDVGSFVAELSARGIDPGRVHLVRTPPVPQIPLVPRPAPARSPRSIATLDGLREFMADRSICGDDSDDPPSAPRFSVARARLRESLDDVERLPRGLVVALRDFVRAADAEHDDRCSLEYDLEVACGDDSSDALPELWGDEPVAAERKAFELLANATHQVREARSALSRASVVKRARSALREHARAAKRTLRRRSR